MNLKNFPLKVTASWNVGRHSKYKSIQMNFDCNLLFRGSFDWWKLLTDSTWKIIMSLMTFFSGMLSIAPLTHPQTFLFTRRWVQLYCTLRKSNTRKSNFQATSIQECLFTFQNDTALQELTQLKYFWKVSLVQSKYLIYKALFYK